MGLLKVRSLRCIQARPRSLQMGLPVWPQGQEQDDAKIFVGKHSCSAHYKTADSSEFLLHFGASFSVGLYRS